MRQKVPFRAPVFAAVDLLVAAYGLIYGIYEWKVYDFHS
jgi:hypothetical protein